MQKSNYITTKDFLVSGEQFNLVHDSVYDMLVTQPQPPEDRLPLYYESDDYISHTDEKKGVLSFLYQLVKKHALKRKVSLINTLSATKSSVLDVGAGTGDFLAVAKNRGWSVSGVEVNSGARDKAAEKGINLVSSLEKVQNKKFDVITLWHVLEHIPNYKETLATLESMLTNSGILIIAVPNFKSYDARHYKEYWAAYDVPRHLLHFSRNSLPKLLESTFALQKIKPMVFDSFYVSLLSEKYKTGKSFSLKAFWIGLLSNIRAWQSKEYSSLIYCFKKTKQGN
ncbi:class I SAM-dependent methyltransferase [Rasiella rasia]|nr:class I SAM-dependent methyltransferase [Rasiella rasia]